MTTSAENTADAGNLLIVDDEPAVRRALERTLRKEGYVIHLAPDANIADRILENESIDVIICDQDLPGRNGIEFLSGAAERFPSKRRLMISGRFKSDEVAEAMDKGAIHKFMPKPWDDAILKADLRSAFRQIMEAYSANDSGPQSWERFSEDRKLSQELHKAAGAGSLTLQYQPQIDLTSGAIVGAEALLRWVSSMGPVRPDRFIALAERNGAMTRLTQWVVREACHRAAQWQPHWPQGHIGLNVSPVDLRDDKLIAGLDELITLTGIPPHYLQIEVTESQAINCDPGILRRLETLAGIGVGLAIDDFGAGATALTYLTDLPFTTLKVDRSLTQQLNHDRGYAVVEKVLEMAKCLGMRTTMEGIETRTEAEAARSLGADAGQGYFFSKPTSELAIEEWIQGGRGNTLS